jgi:hypothetical protein
MSNNKTLIGKDGWLFLKNDSANEIQKHIDEFSNIRIESLHRYDIVKNKYFITIFPDKCFVCRSKLPYGYDVKYRADLDVYKKKFGDYLFDGYEVIGDEIDKYYKTDNHMNFKGTVQIYFEFVKRINSLFNLDLIEKKVNVEFKIVDRLNDVGHGDLTWSFNIGDQILYDITDIYYYSNDITDLYPTKILENKHGVNFLTLENVELKNNSSLVIGELFDWHIVSKYILHRKNKSEPKYKVLIFYDSFLLSTLFLYLDLFDEVYMQKNMFDQNLVDVIKPDYVFEFRVERFLI